MKTKFPYSGRIDYAAYLDDYLKRPDAIRGIPTEAELLELARKAIVREQLVLVPLPEGTPAAQGDTAVLQTVSALPKFNKERVTVSLGRGLYNKELELALIGRQVGEQLRLTVQDCPVEVRLLELKRKQAPEPTDEMVAALEQKDLQGNPLLTVAAYRDYIRKTKTEEALANINYYTMEKILADYPISDYDEEDIRILGELEAEKFKALFLEKEGIDLTKQVPKEWEEDMNVHSLADFIAMRRDWYKMKIQQCLIFLNILDLPCRGQTDPLDHYEVLSELQLKMFDRIRKELERRNRA